jgi:cephalosporin hydroxylase
MHIIINTETKKMIIEEEGKDREISLYSKEAFEIISREWVKVGWNEKYQYTFTWMGRPIIQLPEDMVRIQEVIYEVKPDIIIETGIAHGGSLIFYASLCRAMNKGRVIGIDIEIRPSNRAAIEDHELFSYITLIEGSSTDSEVVACVNLMIKEEDIVLVILDSCHTKEHVLNELEAYCNMITPGSYIVATDGIMFDLYDVPRGKPKWEIDNPVGAVNEFLESHPEFVLEEPKRVFNESGLSRNITHWPNAWLRKNDVVQIK